ncbi:glycosyltransferase family 8 protein [Pleomassaria siparia CBS 279.74]|uniref:Glycosyltransferase family 8 protein n=1 Tax=Pleomassaria siparia CBS 279.74 TaxID=1314801 RepID=A0A6G1K7S2_9PLEO|nr:glycosyltransferase family 8 protein [Pleomassaria siparia CBS 279.74]
MVSNWIPLQQYKPLRASEDSDPATMAPVSFLGWLGLRRVRTALIAGALLLTIYSLTRFVDVPTTFHHRLSQNTNASTPASASAPGTGEKTPGGDRVTDDGVKWSDFAYVQYVTNENYLCNSLMILESLNRVKVKADIVMMYPEGWQVPKGDGADATGASQLLAQARDRYHAKLVPIQVQSFSRGDSTWKDSYTKLLAFNQTQYKRLLSLDSDATVMNNMDELFLTPSSPVAMPRAYWLDQPFLSSQLLLVEPSDFEWQRIQNFMNSRADSGFDMDILNTLYKDNCVVLPHRQYDMLSAEFRGKDHSKYLGSDEVWDGPKALKEAKFVHFSDWPVPKPWLRGAESIVTANQPKCVDGKSGAAPDCTNRDIWLSLYKDFSDRRQKVCGRPFDRRRHVSRSEMLSAGPRPRYEPIVA